MHLHTGVPSERADERHAVRRRERAVVDLDQGLGEQHGHAVVALVVPAAVLHARRRALVVGLGPALDELALLRFFPVEEDRGDRIVLDEGGIDSVAEAAELEAWLPAGDEEEDARTGRTLWANTEIEHTAAYCSPVVVECGGVRQLLTMTQKSVLGVDVKTGKLLWSKDILRDNNAKNNEWGMSSSPLVVDDLVVVSAGGRDNRSLVAYHAGTGELVWGSGGDGAGYSSPCLVNLAGVAQILIFNSGGVAAHDPATGTNLWKYRWPGGHPHVAMPVVIPGERLLVSSGYGVGSELVQIQKGSAGAFSAGRVWKSSRLKAKFTNLVYRDGFVYGLDDGIMVCLDASNGERRWKEGRYGHGQEILVGDVLLVTAESGEVILLDPSPQASRELTRFAALKGKMWNPPALAGQYLLVRNEKEAACYRLPVAPFQMDNDLRVQVFYEGGYLYSDRTSDTSRLVSLPPNTYTHGLRLRFRYDGMRRNLGIKYYRVTGRGTDLGERLLNASLECLEEGHRRVVARPRHVQLFKRCRGGSRRLL